MHLSSPHAQRDDIQGLRALAVLSVLLFHLNAQWLPGGFIGVDIFFVISGYLITGILWRQKLSNQGSLMGFYAARIRRIVPAYMAMIAFSALAASVLFIESDYGRFAESAQSAGLFFSNVFFAAQADYFAPAAHELPLLHTWSLAIEMQFYLLLPLLMRLLPARLIAPALWALLLVGLAASEWWLRVSDSGAVYFSLLARAPEFLVGGLLAIRTRPVFASAPMMHAASIAGLAMLLLSLVFFTSKTPFPGIASMLPCIGAALLIATPQGVVARVLSLRAMVGIGALSYSLYLWHWPVLALARYVSGEYILVPALMASCLVVMLLLSVLSYRLIEQPFRRPLPKRAWGAIAVAVGVLIGSAALLNPRLAPVPLPLTRYADEVGICHGDIEGDCVRGNKSAARDP